MVDPVRIRIASFGDLISNGSYKFHSSFIKATNFERNGRIISLVTEEVGAGPVNIVLNGLLFPKTDLLLVEDEHIRLNNLNIPLEDVKTYNSRINGAKMDINALESNLRVFRSILTELAPSKSLVFLLDEQREKDFTTDFEKEYVKVISKAVNEIIEGEFIEGVKKIKGTGYGLTPSGDDFLTGFLSGIFVLQEIYGSDLSDVRKEIYSSAIGNNSISNTFLYCAFKGRFFEKFRMLVYSICHGQEQDIILVTRNLFSTGETSGADTITGFLFALRKKDLIVKGNT
ncbi:MAG: DUF2877 domain-containing protein [Candidatus Odinarchaeota archaeon]